MAAGKILLTLTKQLKKLVERKKITDMRLKDKSMSKADRVKAEKSSDRLGKSADRVTKQMNKAKTTTKDPQRLATEQSNRKRQTPDSAKELQFTGADAQRARMGSYAGRDKEMVRLREAIKKAKEKTNLSDKAKEELKRNEAKLKDMTRRLGKPADEKKAGGPIVKKPMGGKVYKNTVSRKHGGAIGVGSALRGFGKGYKKG